MNRLLPLLALVGLLALPLHADKLTADPNATSEDNAAEAAQAKDARLDKKITCYSGAKRLHSVTDELTRLTGVTIRCGSTSKDWQVRDIPVVVCANDLALGTLLKTLAEAAHVSLRVERPEENDAELRYRLARDRKTQEAINSFLKDRRETALAESRWAWDALTKVGKLPDKELMRILKKDPQAAGVAAKARLFAALPQEARGRVFAGGSVRVNVESGPTAGPASEFFENGCPSFHQKNEGSEPDEEMELKGITIKLDEGDGMKLPTVYLEVRASSEHSGQAGSLSSSDDLDRLERIPWLGLPPRHVPDAASYQTHPPAGYRVDGAEFAHFSRKAKVEAPKDRDRPVFADWVTALSKASGVSIICEDFQSRHSNPAPPSDRYGEMTLADGLSKRGPDEWSVADDGRLVLGRAWLWQVSHSCLMPESVIEDLTSKLKGDGVMLDDLASMLTWSRPQREEWIYDSRDLRWLGTLGMVRPSRRDEAIWGIYGSLEPEDRELARSAKGLPLSKLDPQWIAGLFRGAFREAPSPHMGFTQDDVQGASAEAVLTDPSTVGLMTMFVRTNPSNNVGGRSNSMELRGEREGEKIALYFNGPFTPIRGPAKEEAKPAPKADP